MLLKLYEAGGINALTPRLPAALGTFDEIFVVSFFISILSGEPFRRLLDRA